MNAIWIIFEKNIKLEKIKQEDAMNRGPCVHCCNGLPLVLWGDTAAERVERRLHASLSYYPHAYKVHKVGVNEAVLNKLGSS